MENHPASPGRPTLAAPWAAAIAGLAGAAGWIAIAKLAGRREAWDSELYFSWLLPSVAIVAAGLGYFSPKGAWRWGYIPFAAQGLVMFVQNPGGNLLPLGLMVLAAYGAVCSVPAIMAAAFRRSADRRGGSPGAGP